MADKKIIKARELASSGASVEKVNLGLRKFNDKVFKHIHLDEKKPVAMEDEVPQVEFADSGPMGYDGGGEHQVQIERFYDDDGELQGLQIICRCGEVIDLEFTRDEDETLPEPGGAGAIPGEAAGIPDDSELEIEQFNSDLSGDQISMDNGTENIEIEEN